MYKSSCKSYKSGNAHHSQKEGRGDPDRRIVLAPELFPHWFDKEMKSNYRSMRQMADKTRLGAGKRYQAGQNLVKRLRADHH